MAKSDIIPQQKRSAEGMKEKELMKNLAKVMAESGLITPDEKARLIRAISGAQR